MTDLSLEDSGLYITAGPLTPFIDPESPEWDQVPEEERALLGMIYPPAVSAHLSIIDNDKALDAFFREVYYAFLAALKSLCPMVSDYAEAVRFDLVSVFKRRHPTLFRDELVLIEQAMTDHEVFVPPVEFIGAPELREYWSKLVKWIEEEDGIYLTEFDDVSGRFCARLVRFGFFEEAHDEEGGVIYRLTPKGRTLADLP